MDKQEHGTTENNVLIIAIPCLENLMFDRLYDRFISMTDTEGLIENISTENLEMFLYQTAQFFYGCRMMKRRSVK